jgi:TldD protein
MISALLLIALAAPPAPAPKPKPAAKPAPAAAPAPASAFSALSAQHKELRDDLVFRALVDELERARGLSLDKSDKPYHLQAYANELESFAVSASFGALTSEGGDLRRTLTVNVRVGDPSLDNTRFQGREWGRSIPAAVPVEPDYDSLRRSLWLRFDEAYKQAVETIAKKRAYLQTNQIKDRPADFAPAPVETVILPRQELKVDKAKWTALVRKASAVFRNYPVVQHGQVGFRAAVSHQYYVASDPAAHRFPEATVMLSLYASAQAADGQELTVDETLTGRTEGDLPSEREVINAAETVAKRLLALTNAKLAAEDYAGPVLFTGEAATAFFLQAVGDPLARARDDLGDSRQGRLTDRLGKHIGIKALTVRDDPTQTKWKNLPLWGHYPIDDDGVKPQPITLVEKGVLKTYYMDRSPTMQVSTSNGHGRGGEGELGNLFVETAQPQTREQLKKRLIELAQEEDLEYGLLVDKLDPSGRGGASNAIYLSTPEQLFKVYPDGREELVRGLTFKPAPHRALKEIMGIGDQSELVNTLLRGQRVSVVAPSVLVKTLELQRVNPEFDKPPYSPRPVLAK